MAFSRNPFQILALKPMVSKVMVGLNPIFFFKFGKDQFLNKNSNPFKFHRYPGETHKNVDSKCPFPLDTNGLRVTRRINGNYFKFCLEVGKVKTIYVKIFTRPRTSNVILMMS